MGLKTVLRAAWRRLLRRLLLGFVNDTRLCSPLFFGPRDRVVIHPTAVVQNALFNTVSGSILIEEHVSFGHNVSLLTGTHDSDRADAERQGAIPREGRDIVVRRGAWIASNATIIGPCEIGAQAVVGAGSVVTRDVAAGRVVAGNPARDIRGIEGVR